MWNAQGLRQNDRCFLYSQRWHRDLRGLPGVPAGFWLQRKLAEPGQELRAAVEAFVAGEPWERFKPPHGAGMEPVFSRRRSPNEAVVALKTKKTRTLGFFTPAGAFVALCCGLAEKWHANDDHLYDVFIGHAASVIAKIDPADVDTTTDVRDLLR